jgi:hypothetical protein
MILLCCDKNKPTFPPKFEKGYLEDSSLPNNPLESLPFDSKQLPGQIA